MTGFDRGEESLRVLAGIYELGLRFGLNVVCRKAKKKNQNQTPNQAGMVSAFLLPESELSRQVQALPSCRDSGKVQLSQGHPRATARTSSTLLPCSSGLGILPHHWEQVWILSHHWEQIWTLLHPLGADLDPFPSLGSRF